MYRGRYAAESLDGNRIRVVGLGRSLRDVAVCAAPSQILRDRSRPRFCRRPSGRRASPPLRDWDRADRQLREG
jgi:hypothetical protein